MKKLHLIALLFTHFFAYAQLDKQEGNLDENGSKTGEWKTYRMELLYSVGNYETGKETGEWKFYHQNGKLSGIGKYENGKQTGEWKFYSSSGKLSSICNYEEDIQTAYKYYDERGKLTKQYKMSKELYNEMKSVQK